MIVYTVNEGGNCPTTCESKCCYVMKKSKNGHEIRCIVDYEGFKAVCLNLWVLQLISYINKDKSKWFFIAVSLTWHISGTESSQYWWWLVVEETLVSASKPVSAQITTAYCTPSSTRYSHEFLARCARPGFRPMPGLISKDMVGLKKRSFTCEI